MRGKNKKNWVYVSALALLIAALWAGVSAYSSFHKSTIPPDVVSLTAPFNPILDPGVLVDVKSRVRSSNPALGQ